MSDPNPVSFAGGTADYTVVGDLPSDVDVNDVLQDLPPGAFAMVGDPETGEIAVIQAAGDAEGRIASAEFSTSAPKCTNCGGGCGSLDRNIRVTVTHNTGINGENYTLQPLSALNFTNPVSTPSAFGCNVGSQQTIDTTGTLTTCTKFSYFFDIVGPDKKRVFVDMAGVQGNIGGLAAADTLCQNAADGAGLGGTWKAWLSSVASSASARLNHATQGYNLVGGGSIVDDFTDLTDGSLDGPIDRDQNGNSVGAVSVWTGTITDGSVGTGGSNRATCTDYTSRLSARTSVFGTTGQTSGSWTRQGTSVRLACNQTANLMCFEQ